MVTKTLCLSRIKSGHPIGPILIASDSGRIVALDFDSPDGRLRQILRPRYGQDITFDEIDCPAEIAAALHDYLDGDLDALCRIDVDAGGTAFQQQAWSALRAIPAGETRTYRQMAVMLGRPDAQRAVGSANALNPVSIVIPCHRLVGSNGALTGYGGGLERKRWLLAHERASLSQQPQGAMV